MPSYRRVIADKMGGKTRWLVKGPHSQAMDFRIVSHRGARDWSPWLYFYEATKRFEQLPQREDGFFLLVEGS